MTDYSGCRKRADNPNPKAVDLITQMDPIDGGSFIPARTWHCCYVDGVTDNYGHTGYPFRTKTGALKAARASIKAKTDGTNTFSLEKDWDVRHEKEW
jgi:hypothetical protein